MKEGRSLPRAVLFDLDGTLVDSLPDIAEALNMLMLRHGLAPHAPNRVAHMIGHGVEALVRRAFADHGKIIGGKEYREAIATYRALYDPRAGEKTKLFPFVHEMLSVLSEQGVQLAVVTNKPGDIARRIIQDLGLGKIFSCILGEGDGALKKPDPGLLFLALQRLKVLPADAVMVGDSAADVMAARAAGMKVILTETGYTATPVHELKADWVVKDFRDLKQAFAFLFSHSPSPQTAD